jgi:hypothetical protein
MDMSHPYSAVSSDSGKHAQKVGMEVPWVLEELSLCLNIHTAKGIALSCIFPPPFVCQSKSSYCVHITFSTDASSTSDLTSAVLCTAIYALNAALHLAELTFHVLTLDHLIILITPSL